MKQRTFENDHQSQWQELEQWLNEADKRTEDSEEMIHFPRRYRQVCQHLALARDRHYTPYLIERLNGLVLRGHQQLYSARSSFVSKILSFLLLYFPHRVRSEASLLGLCCLLFFGSGLMMFIAVQINPDLIYSMMDREQVQQFEAMYDPTAERWGYYRDSGSNFLMFGFYVRHNTTIGFQTFAGGILFGLGTLFFLLFNGLFLGAVAGHLTGIGHTVPFYAFVAGHSSVELTAIVLAGVAGMKLGFALIAPCRQTRLSALRYAATTSIPLIYGVMLLLFLAAFIEAFWSSISTIDPFIKYTVGLTLWTLLITYLVKAGRNHAD
jgi:uncharacterized membrane protein SpoIIM required for sporulation